MLQRLCGCPITSLYQEINQPLDKSIFRLHSSVETINHQSCLFWGQGEVSFGRVLLLCGCSTVYSSHRKGVIMNKYVCLFVLALIGFSLAQEKTTITWLTLSEWGGDGDISAVIDAFEAENPDIEVVLDQMPFNDLFTQIQIRMNAGGSDPDVLSVDVPVTAGYGIRGWLAPLDDVFSEEEKADWLEAALAAGTYEGQLISAPVSTSTQVLIYNKALFDRAGITPPGHDERLTWEQIAELAPQLTFDEDGDGTPDIWGFNWEQTIRIYQLQALAASLGGAAIGEDGLTVDGVINSPEWVNAFTYYQNMFTTLRAAPQSDTITPPDLFRSGNLAMFVGGPWNIRNFATTPLEFEWGVSRHPYFEGGSIAVPTGSWHIGVSATSDQPEAAKRFVEWITTGQGAETWWRDGSGDFPAQKSVLALFADEAEFDTPPLSYIRTAADEASANGVPRAVTVGFLEYEQILQDAFNDIRNGSDVKTSLDTAASRIASEMAKYQ
jgi:ABC-type glycerol-3-phosphate transport system substrate-binding protein